MCLPAVRKGHLEFPGGPSNQLTKSRGRQAIVNNLPGRLPGCLDLLVIVKYLSAMPPPDSPIGPQSSYFASITMSTGDSDMDMSEDVQGVPAYPSYEEYSRGQGVLHGINNSRAFHRLIVRLEGPLATSVSVMNEEEDPDAPCEPYYHEATDTWHPISQEQLCDPPISSVKTTFGCLEEWE